jgi:hypothetical protein
MALQGSRTAFAGGIRTDDFSLVHQILREWLGASFNVRVKLTGEQLTYDDERLSIYCYRAYTQRADYNEFLLEGATVADLAVTRDRLAALSKKFQENGLDADFEYYQKDEAGRRAGETFFVPED